MESESNAKNQIWRAVLSWKTISIIILIGLALYSLTPKIIGATEAIKLLLRAKFYFILMALIFEASSYFGAGWMLQTILRVLNYRLHIYNMIRLSVLNAFAIHALPVGGLGETAVNFYFLNRMGVSSGITLLMFVIKNVFLWISFGVFFFAGLILAPTHWQVTYRQEMIILILLLLAFLFLWYLIHLYNNKGKMHTRAQFLARIFSWFLEKIFKKKALKPERVDEVVDDIYQGMTLFRRDKKSIVPTIAGGLLYWAGDIFCLGLVFLSFGHLPHIGILFFGYTIAAIISLISLIPGGIGVMEASLGLLFNSLGVPGSVAWMSTLVFRLISFWLPFLVGIWAFASLKKETNKPIPNV